MKYMCHSSTRATFMVIERRGEPTTSLNRRLALSLQRLSGVSEKSQGQPLHTLMLIRLIVCLLFQRLATFLPVTYDSSCVH